MIDLYFRHVLWTLRKLVVLLIVTLFTITPLTLALSQNKVKSLATNKVATNSKNTYKKEKIEKQDILQTPERAANLRGGEKTTDSRSDSIKHKNDQAAATSEQTDHPQKAQLTDASKVPSERKEVETLKQMLPQADESSGALVYSYLLDVPPGRNGLQPDVKLTYNSQLTNLNDVFGNGWSTNIHYIERINRKGSEKLYTENYFNSSLSGEIIDLGSGSFGSKVDNGQFLSYSLSSNIWTVKDKSGTVYKFGNTIAARQDNPNDSTKIFKWMLEEVRDTNDNYVKYEYYKDAGEIYPSKIKYTGNGITDGIFEVEFIRQSRSDILKSNTPAFTITTAYRINQILAKVNGTCVRKYDLAYTTAGNSNSSVIQSIQETGLDEAGTGSVSKPAIQFSYVTSTGSWTQQTTNWELPEDLFFNRFYNGADKGGRILDINGDGQQDFLISHDNTIGGDKRIYLNNGSGWTQNTAWTIPDGIWTTQSTDRDTGVRIADVNGDNLPDFILSLIYTNDGSFTQKVYLNNGTDGWTEQTSNWQLPELYFAQSNNRDAGGRIADINGDGLPDLFISHYIPTAYPAPIVDQRVYLNTGSGWVQNTSWVFPEDFHLSNYYSGKDQGTRLLDINGDGLLDAITNFQEDHAQLNFKTRTYINTGAGWVTETNDWIVPNDIVFARWDGGDAGGRIADFNGDGLPDLFMIQLNNDETYTKRLYVNKGAGGWVDATSSWALPDSEFTWTYTKWDQGARTADINGDGLEDIIIAQQGSTGPDDRRIYLHDGNKVNLISTITYPSGGSTSITYKASGQYKTNPDGFEISNPKLPFILQTAHQITNNDGFGTVSAYIYNYEGGRYYYGGPFDHKFAGFSKITKADAAGTKTTTYFHQGDASDALLGESEDHNSKIGRAFRIEIADSSGKLYVLTSNKWDRVDLNNGRSFIKLGQTLDMTYDGTTSHRDKAETLNYDDSNGNLLTKIKWGEVSGTASGTFTDIGNDKFTFTVIYAFNITLNLFQFPSQEITFDQNGNRVKETRYYYDELPLGSINKGNLTKEEKWKSGNSYVDKERTYNTYGLVVQEKDARDKITNYSYDNFSLYTTSATNPLNQTTQYDYDYSCGKVRQIIDPNNLVFLTKYDGLDRTLEEKQPDPSDPSLFVNRATYTYTDLVIGIKTQKSEYLNGSATKDTYSYTDGFDRLVQVRKKAEEADTFTVTDYVYNNIEQLQKESLPYFSTGSAKTNAITDKEVLMISTYDPLYRVISIENAVGTTIYTYDDWKLTVTDARGNSRNLYKDANGMLIKVEEFVTGNTYTTHYEYNGLGNLTNITDANNNIRTFTYDGLGRRLVAQDLHAPADTSFGTWNFAYDDNGNLLSRTDPNNQTVNYTYDDLNRILTEDYAGQSGTEVIFTYDNCTNGIGRLCSVQKGSASESRQYNSLGLVTRETKVIHSTIFQTDYVYDRLGNVLSIKNPDNSQIRYEYNNAGLLEKILYKEGVFLDFISIVLDIDYTPINKFSALEFANGAKTTNLYDPSNLYRLKSKITTLPTTGGTIRIQDLVYTYDPNGNITRIIDNSATNSKKTANYGYDALNRLTSATCMNAVNGQNYSQTYTYDALGNMTFKNDQGTYTYNGSSNNTYANPHAVTSIGTTAYTYDNNGNLLTTTEGLSHSWDYNNRLIRTVTPSLTATYEYDHTGQRLKYSNGVDISLYPSKNYNITGTTAVKHIFAGDQLIATINGGGTTASVFSVHTDHLAGSSVISSQSATIEEVLDYYPFGEIRLDQKAGYFSEQRKFTGHEYDRDTNLAYMVSRYYNGTNTRFLSQDPVFLGVGNNEELKERTQLELYEYLSDPQGLNSYSYVKNNPLVAVDPNGEWVQYIIGEKNAVALGNWANNLYNNNSVARYAMDHPYQAGAAIGLAGGAAVAGGVIAGGGAITCGLLCGGSGATMVAGGAALSTQASRDQQTVQQGLRIGESFGKLGTVIQNIGAKVTGYTQHGLDQKITRGISSQVITNTVKNPLAVLQQSGGTRLFLSEKAAVVLNKAGQVVTTYGSNMFRGDVKSIINQATSK